MHISLSYGSAFQQMNPTLLFSTVYVFLTLLLLVEQDHIILAAQLLV